MNKKLLAIALPVGLAIGLIFVAAQLAAAGPAATQPLEAAPVTSEEPALFAAQAMSYNVFLPIVFNNWPPLPPTTTLHVIDKQPLDSVYTVTWDAVVFTPTVTHYTLQESADAGFSATVEYSSTVNSFPFTGKTLGGYYYRVRAHNMWGPGGWSNIEYTTVLTRHDDFDNPITGWAKRRTSSPDLNLLTVAYFSGTLRTELEDKFDFGIASPMLPAPALPYTISMLTRAINLGNLNTYGIVFGGNGGSVCPIDRSTSGDPNGCFFHYYRLNVIHHGGGFRYGIHRIDYHMGGEDGRGHAVSTELMAYTDLENSALGWLHWELEVYADGFALFVNEEQKAWIEDTTYINEPYYGMFISNDEYNHSYWEHDYFYVDPISATNTLLNRALLPITTGETRLELSPNDTE